MNISLTESGSERMGMCFILTGTGGAAQVAVGGLLRAVGGRTAAVAREQPASAVISSDR